MNEMAAFGTDIEYEVDGSNIVPNYWLRIDWNSALERRAAISPKLDLPANYVGAELTRYEVDHYEDCRLLLNPKYHALIRCLNAPTLPVPERHVVEQRLKEVLKDALPPMMKEEDDGESALNDMISSVLSSGERGRECAVKQKEQKQWSLGKRFQSKMVHFRKIHWKSAKINFDSGIGNWRRSVPKWRFSVFADRREHIEWRQRILNRELSDEDLALCRRAVLRLEQLDHLIVARRSGPELIEQLVMELEDDVMRVLYLWFEELCQNGEEIAMGAPWAANRYRERPLLPNNKTPQIPIEYFKVPLDHKLSDNAFIHKSH